MKKVLGIIIALLALQGCTSTLAIKPIPQEGQYQVYKEGVEAVLSDKNALVAIRPSSSTYNSSERPTIVISVLNKTNEPFNFSTDNVHAYLDGEPLRVFTYEELAAEVKKAQAWAAVAAALNGMAQSMNAANAGYTYQSGSFNASAYGNNGYSAHGYGSYSGYSYNAAAAQQAQAAANAQTQAKMDAIRNQTEQSLAQLSSTILRKSTVMPQSWHGGYIALDNIADVNQPHEIKLLVDLAGEVHEFTLDHLKIQ